MPEARRDVPSGRVFDAEQMARLRDGLLPEEMEDKWLVVWNDGGLDVHRSWTGHHLYRATFEPARFGCERVARLTVNRDPAQLKADDDDGLLAAQFAWCCDALVLQLRRGSLFPDRLRAPSVTIVRGDITKESCDAIVNAANEALAGGGGVDGAIHDAAGRQLQDACLALPIVPGPGGTRPIRATRCPTGESRVTPAFGELRARWVVHAVGPIHGVPDDAALLRRAFDSAFDAAVAHGARRVTVPAISCGAFRFPLKLAARIALDAARTPRDLDEVRFVLFDADAYDAWRAQLPER
ncbi:MAG TPA: macro domain-containing protein [Kofleriaceae bacterium]|nr:macro domain-containing protein [Kofleriaceae bacterium]